jgi:hypothetical protein
MRAKKVFQIAAIALFAMCFTAWAKPLPQQIQPTVPTWADLPADTSVKLGAEGIDAGKYERLLQGEVVTEQRPVPAGKSGVHVASFGAISGSFDKLWYVLDNCGNSHPILPYLQSCTIVEPDHPLPPNRRWEQVKIDFRMLFFSTKTMVVNEKTIEAPNYLRWKQVRGDAKVNEGYFRIISITPGTQLVVYDALVDPGPLIPGFVKAWVVKNTLPEVIVALRDHV